MKSLRKRVSARVRGVMGKAKFSVVLIIIGLVIGIFVGYGILRLPRFVFNLMMLLTFIWMLIWTVKKRRVSKRPAKEVKASW